jgi:phosphoribosylformimino-5-aminoimidazole carboxamide ribotide isomerase
MMTDFIVYPAIDLRGGKVVRLRQGDPNRQTVYGSDPASAARRWLAEGAMWLHVINLDGALDDAAAANANALREILSTGARVQFGGGLRTLSDIERVIELGVSRAILGTVAVENPDLVRLALQRFGADRIGVGIDARGGRVRVRGWEQDAGIDPIALGLQLREMGVTTIVFTDITRDGVGRGINVEATERVARETGLSVIAAGGAVSLDDVRRTRQAGLAGVIVGRALYEGQLSLAEILAAARETSATGNVSATGVASYGRGDGHVGETNYSLP